MDNIIILTDNEKTYVIDRSQSDFIVTETGEEYFLSAKPLLIVKQIFSEFRMTLSENAHIEYSVDLIDIDNQKIKEFQSILEKYFAVVNNISITQTAAKYIRAVSKNDEARVHEYGINILSNSYRIKPDEPNKIIKADFSLLAKTVTIKELIDLYRSV